MAEGFQAKFNVITAYALLKSLQVSEDFTPLIAAF